MSTPVTNFGLVTVSTTYDAAATSIVLTTGHGSRLPSTFPYPMVWWNATDYPHPADDPNVEIVSVTNRSSDTLTVTRAQESTSASTKNTGGKTYRMSLSFTKAMFDTLRTARTNFNGLQLQTHRDSDLAPSQVELVTVDYIEMDDGTVLRNDSNEWSGKLADITVSGAGGLDTGTENSGEWYEIYAIAKEDGTRNLLLHESKLWAINTNSVAEDADQGIRSAVDNSTVKVAQGFKSGSGVVKFIEAKLKKVGSPTGKIYFTIETDNAGKPSGSAVATTYAFDVSKLSTTATELRFPIKSSATLNGGATQYHIVAQGTWAVSATDYVAWRMDGSAAAYASGSKALFDSDTSTWTLDTDDDMWFQLGLESSNASVTMPSGYTKKCLLGWVYNDGSSNFVPFTQYQKSWRFTRLNSTDNSLGSLSGTIPQLYRLEAYLPPRDIMKVQLAITGTGSAAGVAAIGDIRSTDLSSGGTTVGAQLALFTAVTANTPSAFGAVLMQSMGLMIDGALSTGVWVVGFDW